MQAQQQEKTLSTAQQKIKDLQEQIKTLKSNIPSVTIEMTVDGKPRKVTVKVGEKNSLLFYGLQKFPISLFLNQLIVIQALSGNKQLEEFIEANKERLVRKEKEEVKA